MKTILIKRTDGGVSIMTIKDSNASVEAEIEKWKGVSLPGSYLSHEEIDPTIVPKDTSKRNLWGHDLKPRKEV